MAVYVAVRLPSQGTVLGDMLGSHPGARVTSVPVTPAPDLEGHLDVLALVEGLPDEAVARILLAWNGRYGRPASVLGESFALRLPIQVEAIGAPGMAEVLRLDGGLSVLGNVMQDDWAEQWIACSDAAEAEAVAERFRQALRHAPGAQVRIGTPRPQDADCWEVLAFAAAESLGAIEAA